MLNCNNLPAEVMAILRNHEADENDYATCQALQDDLEQIGWTCDWGLDAVPYNLRELNTTMGEKHEVKCNKCNFSGFEDELVSIEDERACPNCDTDSYLMDI